MARTVQETASILMELYDENFCSEESEPYQISWEQLRGIAGVERLTDDIIANVGKFMLDSDYVLVPFNNFILIGMEANYKRTRKVPARIAENYLAVSSDELLDDDGDQEIENDDN
jgi:hypothetical protein